MTEPPPDDTLPETVCMPGRSTTTAPATGRRAGPPEAAASWRPAAGVNSRPDLAEGHVRGGPGLGQAERVEGEEGTGAILGADDLQRVPVENDDPAEASVDLGQALNVGEPGGDSGAKSSRRPARGCRQAERRRLRVAGERFRRLRCSGKSPAGEERIAASISATHTARIPSGGT
jgi:hypothetical protein